MGLTCDRIFDVTAGTAIGDGTTDFFTAFATPAGGIAKLCTFTVSVSGGVKLYLRMVKDGVTKNMPFNADAALVADAPYTFSFIITGNATYTFRSSAACTVNYCTGVLSVE